MAKSMHGGKNWQFIGNYSLRNTGVCAGKFGNLYIKIYNKFGKIGQLEINNCTKLHNNAAVS